ncbi:transposase domain-containing protein [Bradyrhizobium elkanii]|nr:transposase domain-containing protein [Bradyrhizobium elkanii]WLA86041.1 transposase domain-containing protein [Bradyrhizobium elkanii]
MDCRRSSCFSWHRQLREAASGHSEADIVASLAETCKLNDFDPLAYLTDAFTRIVNGHPNSNIDELLPRHIVDTTSKPWPENDAYTSIVRETQGVASAAWTLPTKSRATSTWPRTPTITDPCYVPALNRKACQAEAPCLG